MRGKCMGLSPNNRLARAPTVSRRRKSTSCRWSWRTYDFHDGGLWRSLLLRPTTTTGETHRLALLGDGTESLATNARSMDGGHRAEGGGGKLDSLFLFFFFSFFFRLPRRSFFFFFFVYSYSHLAYLDYGGTLFFPSPVSPNVGSNPFTKIM